MPPILHIIRSSSYGGLELYVVRLIKELARTGVPTSVYCLGGTKLCNDLTEAGIAIHLAKGQGQRDLGDILQLRKIIKKDKIGLVHSHTRLDVWIGSLATIGLTCKHVTSVYMKVGSKRDPIHAFIYGRVTCLVSTSNIQNNLIMQRYPVKPQQVKLLRYGCDLTKYRIDESLRAQIRARQHADDGTIVVGTLSRIDSQKGLRELAESFLQLPPDIASRVTYWIIGEPSLERIDHNGRPVYEHQSLALKQWLVNFIRTNKLANKIRLIPFQKEYIPVLSAIDIYVLGSHEEMYSLGLIEAMLMQRSVIGTNSGGTPEQIAHNERGLLVKPGSSTDFAQAISRYVNDQDLMQRMGGNAHAWAVREHAMANTLMRVNRIYEACKRCTLQQPFPDID